MWNLLIDSTATSDDNTPFIVGDIDEYLLTNGSDEKECRVILDDLLTGDEMPSGVLKRLALGEDAEVRECHYGHQLASAAAKASVTWSTMLGCISTSAPNGYSRPKVAKWVGQEPDYSVVGTDLGVDSKGDNGEGLLGIKFHAGAAGYRSKQIKTGSDGNELYAYAV